MTEELKKGDVVYLLSGGPAMTVIARHNATMTAKNIEVVWIKKDDSLASSLFPEECLEKAIKKDEKTD